MMRTESALSVLAVGLCLSGCAGESGRDATAGTLSSGSSADAETDSGPTTGGEAEGTAGDGDGDSTTGDGDSSSTGDGDSTTTTTGDGDSTTGDGDGDGDGTTTTTGDGEQDWSEHLSSVTHYTPIDDGRCGFQTIPSNSAPHGRIAALPTWLFGGAQWCGAFIEIDSSTGSTFESCGGVNGETITVMVSDECPESTNQEHCYNGAWHFDLSQPAFSDMANLSCGVLDDLQWRIVEGTFTGSVKVRNKDGINPWWYSLYVEEHNYAITNVEIRPDGGDWQAATRSDTNFWNIESNSGVQLPLDIRITDIHGQVISADDMVTNLNENAEFDMGAQFPAGMGGGGTLGP